MANESSSTVSNQINPVGSRYESKKSRILAPREGNLLIQETSFTTLRLTKTSNNPPTYRKEIFQHESAKDGGNIVQIGVVKDDGKIEFNSQLDTGKANEELFKKQIEKQVKTQTNDAESKIKKLVNPDKRGINRKRSRRTSQEDDSKDSPKKVEPSNKGIARKNYGTLFYPSFIQKSSQDKLKVTILEFSSRFKGGKKDTKKMSSLGKPNRQGKPPNRSDYGTNRSEKGKYLAALRKYENARSSDLNNANMSALSLDGRKRMEIDKRLVGHITLPIPDGVTDQNKVDFGGGTMNALQVGGAEVALDFLLRGIGKAGETAGDVFKQAAIDKNVQQAIGGLLASAGVGIDANELLARTQGNINNNNLELLFKGPTLRPFTFQFNLSPRDVQEAGQVQKIIRAFKQSSSVQRTPGGIFLATPNTYKLEFIDGKTSSTHRFLPKIKECALLGVNVNYMPDNSYMTYENSSMVAYNLQLAFQEMEPIFNDDYEDSDQEQLPGTVASSVTTAFNIGF